MSRLRPLSAALVAALLGSAAPSVTLPAMAAAEADMAKDTVRPAIGKPLQEAQKLVVDHKYKEALAKVQQADGVKNKTPYERFVIDEVRGFAARGAGDTVTAIRSLEAVVAAHRLPPAEQLRYEQTLALDYYTAKNYSKAIQWATRYVTEGGTDGQVRTLLAQSDDLAGDYANAGKELHAQIEAAQRAGRTPPENLLAMLADNALKQKDDAGYTGALWLLVAAYPKKEYWLPLLHQIERAPGFAARLQLDLDRIKLATGTMTNPADYLDMTQQALADGLPGEARKTIEQGYAAGILGSGADADRQKRLRDLAAKSATEDQKTLDKSVGEAVAQQDGDGLIDRGLDDVGYGQVDKGLALIEQGIKKGNLKRPEDARLHLGIAYIAAGQRAKAIEVLRTVQGTDGAADLARAWILYAKAPA